MGLRLTCESCDNPIYDSEPRYMCEECDQICCDFCSQDGSICPFCDEGEVKDEDLLEYALKVLNWSREDLRASYLNKEDHAQLLDTFALLVKGMRHVSNENCNKGLVAKAAEQLKRHNKIETSEFRKGTFS